MLHILCGFSVDEIASALVSTHVAIEKRITRAKRTLAKSKGLFNVTAPTEISSRLPACILPCIYCLTRATTERTPSLPFAANFAAKPCV
jgi:RNA polymerase sigma-70 factor (ECF subfamily)